jgi:restriction endonuclease
VAHGAGQEGQLAGGGRCSEHCKTPFHAAIQIGSDFAKRNATCSETSVRIALVGLALLVSSTVVSPAMQIGQTRDAIVAQHGPAVEENHAMDTAVYRSGLWKVDVSYDQNTAKILTFTKTDPLGEAEIRAILAQNAGGATWHELQISGSIRQWQRSDLATAQSERVRPRSIRLINSPYRTTQQKRTQSPIASRDIVLTRAPLLPPPRSALLIAILFLAALIAMALKLIRRQAKSPPAVAGVSMQQAHALEGTAGNPLEQRATVPRMPEHDGAPAPSLDTIGWENFELLVGEIFRRKGYEVEITSGLGADGGQDLLLRKDGALYVVQCKNFERHNRVTASAMRDFFGLITAEHAASGFFVTSGYFSDDAKKFADGKPIELIARQDVEDLMREVAIDGENLCDVRLWILSFATKANVVDPICPRCDGAMKLKRGFQGRAFWSCVRFPRCLGNRNGRAELLRALAG